MQDVITRNLEELRMATTTMERDRLVAEIMEQFDTLYREKERLERVNAAMGEQLGIEVDLANKRWHEAEAAKARVAELESLLLDIAANAENAGWVRQKILSILDGGNE